MNGYIAVLEKTKLFFWSLVFVMLCLSSVVWCSKNAEQDERLFMHAERIGSIKEELREKAKKFRVTSAKKEKSPIVLVTMTENPESQDFKYSQSIVHLALFLNGNVVLEPRPKDVQLRKKWLWNDGHYHNAEWTEYEVIDGKEFYISRYNKNKKVWENALKKSMSYLTYYQYLIKKKGYLRPFIEYMVTKAIEKVPEMFLLKYEKNKTKSIAELVELFTTIILVEEQHKDKYVFYSGYPGYFELVYDFITILSNYFNLQSIHLERSELESAAVFEPEFGIVNRATYESAAEFLKENDFENTFFLMSANPWLFGNLGILSECTARFFLSGGSVSAPDISLPLEILKKLCQGIGLAWDDKILSLANEYEKLGGRLKQIFIFPSIVDTIVYLSRPAGFKLRKDPLTECLAKLFFGKSVLSDVDYKNISTSQVLGLIRTDPTNKCLLPNGKFLNELQVRLLHYHPVFFDVKQSKKAGLDMKYYFAEANKSIELEQLRKKLTIIIRSMIMKALKSDTIKSKGIKLKNLYREMKKA